MKTKLPEAITTIEEAKAFLTELNKNHEAYHPEDDAHDIIDWHGIDNDEDKPTVAECDQLNKLMSDIYLLPGNDGKHDDSIVFCPCGFLLELDEDYVKMRDADLQQQAAPSQAPNQEASEHSHAVQFLTSDIHFTSPAAISEAKQVAGKVRTLREVFNEMLAQLKELVAAMEEDQESGVDEGIYEDEPREDIIKIKELITRAEAVHN